VAHVRPGPVFQAGQGRALPGGRCGGGD
jgi:hypothetical protein